MIEYLDKYFLPYEDITDQVKFPYFIRRHFTQINKDWRHHPSVWKDNYGQWWKSSPMKRCKSKLDAMAEMDRSLIEQGYILLSEERAEKIKLLL